MNGYEMTRMFCYAISAPTLLYLALALIRSHRYAQATFYLAISFLFAWFVFEAWLTSTGVNTREMRLLATPLVVVATGAIALMAAQQANIWRKFERRQWRRHSMDSTAG